MRTFRELFNDYLDRNGISVEKAGVRLHISRPTAFRYARGASLPSWPSGKRFAKALEVEPEALQAILAADWATVTQEREKDDGGAKLHAAIYKATRATGTTPETRPIGIEPEVLSPFMNDNDLDIGEGRMEPEEVPNNWYPAP